MEETENIEDIVNYFAISLFGQSTVSEILWDLAKNCISKLGFEDCVIYLVDEERSMLVQKAAYGPKNPVSYAIYQPIEIPVGQGIVGSVAQYARPEIISDTTKDPRYIQDDAFRYSELSVPIILNDKVIGVIDSEHSKKDFFTDKHLRIMKLAAGLCANKIMWARATEKIEAERKASVAAQNKLTALTLQAMQMQMNPHLIFNALNAIQHFITSHQTSLALKYLSIFAKFIRNTLQTSKRTFLTIAEEVNLLTYYLELEKMRFDGRINYELLVRHQPEILNYEIPVLLIQPVVERILVDVMLNDQQEGLLKIDMSLEKDELQCRIYYPVTNERGDFLSRVLQNGLGGTTANPWNQLQERISLMNKVHQTHILITPGKGYVSIHIPDKTSFSEYQGPTD